jgi:hypothetical protein
LLIYKQNSVGLLLGYNEIIMNLDAQAQNIVFYSGLQVDKVAGLFNGSFTNSSMTTVAFGYRRFAIPHQFGRPVFVKLLWSTDNSNWVDGGASSNAFVGGQYFIGYSDSNNIYILGAFSIPAFPTIYYRIVAIWIDDYSTSTNLVNPLQTGSDLIFDSRLNFQKIARQGEIRSTGSGATEVITIDHNLGYKPIFRVYHEAFIGQVWPAQYGGMVALFTYDLANQAELDAYTTDNSLVITQYYAAGSPRRIWYKVYYGD